MFLVTVSNGGELFMRCQLSNQNLRHLESAAFSRVDLLAAIYSAFILVGLLMTGFGADLRKAPLLQCRNNLKNVGSAFYHYAMDHNQRYPMMVSTNAGGSSEFFDTPSFIYYHFKVMSNYLITPRVVVCPADIGLPARKQATNFQNDFLANNRICYFVGVEASPSRPTFVLSGDRNITNSPAGNSQPINPPNPPLLVTLGTNVVGVGWNQTIHESSGNVLLGNGSVHHTTASGFRELLRKSGSDRNWLAVPN
jgi:hypothetical protein